ncbi:MAG: HAD family hydrolase [Alphaproteobacteria bacterium]|nr:HAD family hydrolase [Alphaproteobacteria bacterium]
MRIAMWCGPRNISTAMMRSFGARADCHVVDEPFYAAYLARTGIDHPMRAETLAAQPSDPEAVIAALFAPLPAAKTLHYQKHMTHHMLDGFDLSWTSRARNAFLIRAPEAVLASYAKKYEAVDLDMIGLPRQAEIFDMCAQRLGAAPPVLETPDVLADPRAALTKLCEALGVEFDPAMLTWRPGIHATDGVWAPAWYDAVAASTGFAAPSREAADDDLPDRLKRIADRARPFYERLRAHKL